MLAEKRGGPRCRSLRFSQIKGDPQACGPLLFSESACLQACGRVPIGKIMRKRACDPMVFHCARRPLAHQPQIQGLPTRRSWKSSQAVCHARLLVPHGATCHILISKPHSCHANRLCTLVQLSFPSWEWALSRSTRSIYVNGLSRLFLVQVGYAVDATVRIRGQYTLTAGPTRFEQRVGFIDVLSKVWP